MGMSMDEMREKMGGRVPSEQKAEKRTFDRPGRSIMDLAASGARRRGAVSMTATAEGDGENAPDSVVEVAEAMAECMVEAEKFLALMGEIDPEDMQECLDDLKETHNIGEDMLNALAEWALAAEQG